MRALGEAEVPRWSTSSAGGAPRSSRLLPHPRLRRRGPRPPHPPPPHRRVRLPLRRPVRRGPGRGSCRRRPRRRRRPRPRPGLGLRLGWRRPRSRCTGRRRSPPHRRPVLTGPLPTPQVGLRLRAASVAPQLPAVTAAPRLRVPSIRARLPVPLPPADPPRLVPSSPAGLPSRTLFRPVGQARRSPTPAPWRPDRAIRTTATGSRHPRLPRPRIPAGRRRPSRLRRRVRRSRSDRRCRCRRPALPPPRLRPQLQLSQPQLRLSRPLRRRISRRLRIRLCRQRHTTPSLRLRRPLPSASPPSPSRSSRRRVSGCRRRRSSRVR